MEEALEIVVICKSGDKSFKEKHLVYFDRNGAIDVGPKSDRVRPLVAKAIADFTGGEVPDDLETKVKTSMEW